MHDLLVGGAGNNDNGRESNIDRGVHGGFMAYVCELAIDMTKLVSCEEVSLRRCEMMNEPSGVGMSVGGAVAYFDVILLVDERYVVAIEIPTSSACMR